MMRLSKLIHSAVAVSLDNLRKKTHGWFLDMKYQSCYLCGGGGGGGGDEAGCPLVSIN